VLSEKNNVVISVVMASYNKEQYIRQTIESILNQTFLNFELIIVDDGSNDRTASLVKNYTEKGGKVLLIENVSID
jgi:glycosyltransferase involved in cell wall biosynthesis